MLSYLYDITLASIIMDSLFSVIASLVGVNYFDSIPTINNKETVYPTDETQRFWGSIYQCSLKNNCIYYISDLKYHNSIKYKPKLH